jgi:hypothetical protein
VTVSVTNVNEAPTITSPATGSVAENAATSTVVYTAAASDVDANDTRSFSLSGADAASFDINATTGAVTLRSSANFEAKNSYSINVVATDAGGLTASQAVTVSVTNVNEAPSAITLTGNTIAENTSIGSGIKIGTLAITDPDSSGNSNVLTVAGVDGSSFAVRNGNELFFTGTSPNFENKNSYTLTVTSTDGSLTFSQPVSVSVTNVNEAPYFNPLSPLLTSVNTSINIPVSAGDPDEGPTPNLEMTYSSASHGTVAVVNGVLTYTPATGYTGADSFTITIKDSGGLTATQTVSLSVVADASITVTNGGSYTATAGVVDTFVIDASKSITATISGLETSDVVKFNNLSSSSAFNVVNDPFGDGSADVYAGDSVLLQLRGLSDDLFDTQAFLSRFNIQFLG